MDEETLTLSKDEMRDLGYKVVDMLVDHWTRLKDKQVARAPTRGEMEQLIRKTFPDHGLPVDEVLKEVSDHIFKNVILSGHPRFFAYIPCPNNFVSAMAGALVSGFNAYAGIWLEGAGPA